MLDPFYLIVDHVQTLQALYSQKTRLIQLRLKDVEKEEMRSQARKAIELCQLHDICFVLNDAWEIAIEEKCPFVHLGQEDLEHADVSALRRHKIRFGVSTHDETELDHALAYCPDYIALGPIYPTKLKAMRWAPQGLEKITRWKERIGTLPLVAIGGMTPERARLALQAGADSVAVVTDILHHENPALRIQEWYEKTKEWR